MLPLWLVEVKSRNDLSQFGMAHLILPTFLTLQRMIIIQLHIECLPSLT